eukprot:gnl/Chilomastix_cuspidata/1447.p1 GENE.gnl/Chilomastix_cuspidata/1447~~gnl/Chilomastix_cuspidata/1447.p1  ORF type:complete len:1205 (+),score=235.27 gnl/Chilomastix_cuspidata/1447:498-3617(+)
MYVIGFAESLFSLLNFTITGDLYNDFRVLGTGVMVVLLIIALVGVGWVVKTDMFLLAILAISILSVFIGIPLSDAASFANLKENTLPASGGAEYGFAACLAIFFPAATGIMAGANISASLKKPQRDIPKGTLLAVVVSCVVYIVLVWFISAGNTRDVLIDYLSFPLKDMSVWFPLVYAGVFAATISSALSTLVGAPRVLQALCVDGLIPFLRVFGKGHGKNNEPMLATLLTFVVAIGCVMIADLNAIVPFISNLYLVTYGLINYACFRAILSKAPSFRPSFRYVNMPISFIGTLLCLAAMLFLDLLTASISLLVLVLLWIFLRKTTLQPKKLSHEEAIAAVRNPRTGLVKEILVRQEVEGHWGDVTRAAEITSFMKALRNIEKGRRLPHVKLYRPNILALTGKPSFRPHLVNFASMLGKKGHGLILCGDIIQTNGLENTPEFYGSMLKEIRLNSTIMGSHSDGRVQYVGVPATTLHSGVLSLITSTGIGSVKPNAVLCGYPSVWNPKLGDEYGLDDAREISRRAREFIATLQDAAMMEMSLIIVRNLEPLFSSFPIPDTIFQELSRSTKREIYRARFLKGCACGASKPTDIKDIPEFIQEMEGSDAPEPLIEKIVAAQLTSSDETSSAPSERASSDIAAASSAAPEGRSSETTELIDVLTENEVYQHFPPSALFEKDSSENCFQRRLDLRKRLFDANPKLFPPVRYPVASEPIEGRIDVLWLVDDGGFTCLMPYLLSQHPAWRKTRLRFLVSSHPTQAKKASETMVELLRALRIDADVEEISHILLVDPHQLMAHTSSRKKGATKTQIIKENFKKAALIDDGSFTILPQGTDGRPAPPYDLEHSGVPPLVEPVVHMADDAEDSSDSSSSSSDTDSSSSGRPPVRQSGTVFDLFNKDTLKGDESMSDVPLEEEDETTLVDSLLVDEEAAHTIVRDWKAKSREHKHITQASNATLCRAAELYTGCFIPRNFVNYSGRFIRLNAVLRSRCADSAMVFITMPVPRLNKPPDALMAILEILSDIPGVPVALIRGNGESVVTIDA